MSSISSALPPPVRGRVWAGGESRPSVEVSRAFAAFAPLPNPYRADTSFRHSAVAAPLAILLVTPAKAGVHRAERAMRRSLSRMFDFARSIAWTPAFAGVRAKDCDLQQEGKKCPLGSPNPPPQGGREKRA
jgi:hypothetical protein